MIWSDFLAQHACAFPNRIALTRPNAGDAVTYGALHERAERWACFLDQRGVTVGDRVAFLATNHLAHLTLLFACQRLGAILVPLNYRLSQAELAEQLAQVTPALTLVAGDCSLAATHLRLEEQNLPAAGDYAAAVPCAARPLLILFTSGSSGRPKGVLLNGRMLAANIEHTRLNWELDSRDSTTTHAPFFHTGGYNVFTLPLLHAGGHLVLLDRFEAGQILDLINAGRVTVFFGVPTMFDLLARDPAFADTDLSRLRFVISGGAPCQSATQTPWRERGVSFRQGFGMTEVGPNCFTIDDETARRQPDAVGRPMPGTRMLVLDGAGAPVADGEIGELCIAGPHLCAGYWQNETAHRAARFDDFWRTGDLAVCDADGCYRIMGRKKEMYISGGENVYPGEVVRHLIELDGVSDALVIGVPDARWGEVGFALLETHQTYDVAACRAFLEPRLSRYKHPLHVLCLAEFPLLANGKVDGKALAARAAALLERRPVHAS